MILFSNKVYLILGCAVFAGCVNLDSRERSDQDQSAELKIAYTTLVNPETSDYDVFVMDIDGSNQRNITRSPGVDWVYYAQGDKLFFVSDRDTCHRCYFVYEMDAEGENVRRIFDYQVYDSYFSARNGGAEFLATTRDSLGGKTIVTYQKNGAITDTLISDAQFDANDACFGPDGNQIVFRSKESGIDELWILDMASGTSRQLTHYPEGDTSIAQHGYHAGPPRWQPDRNLISYASNQNGNYSIFGIQPDGSGAVQLTPDDFTEVYHAWSPDGSMLVYDGAADNRAQFDIYLMTLVDGKIVQLTSDSTWQQGPVFVRGNVD